MTTSRRRFRVYNGRVMPRTLTKPRPKQGQLLVDLRKNAGLSQQELAEILKVPQQNIAFWEQSDKPPRSEVLPAMADILGVQVKDLIYQSDRPIQKSRNKPTGKLQQVFNEASSLPRRQQERIIEFVSAFVNQYKESKSN